MTITLFESLTRLPEDEFARLDIIMPSGKRLRDCTGQECGEIGEFLNMIGRHIGDRKISEREFLAPYSILVGPLGHPRGHG